MGREKRKSRAVTLRLATNIRLPNADDILFFTLPAAGIVMMPWPPVSALMQSSYLILLFASFLTIPLAR
jgi:hypothetical protein